MARLTRVRMVAGLTYSVWAISLSATRMPGRAGRRHCPRGWTGACPGFTWSPPTSRQPGCPVSRRLSGLPGTDAARLSASRRVLCARRLALIAVDDHGVHLPSVKMGCHRLSGQKRTEMMYWPQLCSDDALPGVVGKCGAAVLRKTPIRT